MSKKVLVTGGAGFIGSALVRYLLNATEAHVLVLDKLTYAGNLESLANVSEHPQYAFEQADICDRAALQRIFAAFQPDCVFHLAAESHVDRSIDSAAEFVQTNVLGTFELLETTRQYWASLAATRASSFRFLHVSTDEVYGDLTASEPSFTESSRYTPSSPYAATKAGSDHLVRAWHRTYGLPVLVTNCSNNYGPYQFPEKLIPHMILSALRGEPLPVYGRGEQIRDWLYVEDHAQALWRVMTAGRVGETYNIGGNNERKNIDLVLEICDVLDQTIDAAMRPQGFKQYKDLVTFVEDRPGHDFRYSIDASKMRDELGWQPTATPRNGLEQTIAWYLTNEDWWARILDGRYRLGRLGDMQASKLST